MAEQKWFTTEQAAPLLAKKDAAAVRRWIRKGRKEGWLQVGIHIKPDNPTATRPTWLLHIERCQNIGDRRKG